ncbi:MAG: hypothetical protein AAB514_03110 [Patescibacteria group bacterium]
MKKEKTKKDSKSEERRTGVVLENIDSKLDFIVEGQQVLDKKIDKVDEKVDELRGEMNYKFGVVFEKFDEVDQKFDEVTGELRVIRNELKEKVGRDEFVILEKRVMNLEKKISQKI